MKPHLRGWLPLCLAMSFLLASEQPASAQRNKPPGPNIGNPNPPGGNNIGQPPQNPFAQPGQDPFGQPGQNPFGQPGQNPFGGPGGGNAAVNAAASSASTGMIVAGIGLILAGLALTGGVVYMALQGQKTGYGGRSRGRKKTRRDDDD